MPENRIGGGRADEARLSNVTEPTAESQEDWSSRLVRHRTALVVVGHGLVFALALFATFLAAYNFRWTVKPEGGLVTWFFEQYLPLLALALPVKLLVFHRLGQYRGSWRYVGIRDLYALIRASLAGTALLVVAYLILENVWQSIFGLPLIDRPGRLFPQSSVFLLDWSATIAFVATARILVRFYYEDVQPQRSSVRSRVLIVGAGDAGEAVLRELLRMRHERYQCVGFVDDDAAHLGACIHGVEIRGRTADIHRVCTDLNVQEVFIAVPHATPKLIRVLVERCEGTGVKFRTIPTVTDLIEGRVQVSQIRDVDIADLLGRAPVELDRDEIGRQLRGKRVLVTGAGGSIGSEMCRQIAAFSPARLVLVERAEHALFEIDRELRKQHPELDISPLVCDVCDRARLDTIFKAEQPSMVIHAAAHKHVPMMEANPGEAIKNNIGGTLAVAEAARRAKTAKMVVISTDKAVNPTSVMGCTKRVAEMYVQTLNGTGVTQFITVRFGNVLGSSGSVVPIFKRQIADGGPVMVTHPDMKRYFMTIPEAAQLVLQAGVMGKGGEIYVLHMGEPVRIVDLARDMITLSGLRPGVDIDIAFSGVRPGEKLFEELSSEGEHIGDTAHPKIGIWKLRAEDAQAMQDGIDRLLAAADAASDEALQTELKRLVPEYTPDPHGDQAPPAAASPAPKTTDPSAVPLG